MAFPTPKGKLPAGARGVDRQHSSTMDQESPARQRIQWAGLLLGPVLALACFLVLPAEYRDTDGQPASFAVPGRVTLAVMVWMATWWLSKIRCNAGEHRRVLPANCIHV